MLDPRQPRIGRRGVLIGLGAVGMAGTVAACRQEGAAPPPPSSSARPDAPGPDALRTDVATAERALIARYDAAIAAFPDLAGQLAAIRGQHADHLAAMDTDGVEPTPVPPPASAAAALADLRSAEQSAARERRTSCVAAGEPELARVLALIAASEQSHAAALRRMDTA